MKRLMLFVIVLFVFVLTKGRAEKSEHDALNQVDAFTTETLPDVSSISVNSLPSEIKVSIVDEFKNAKICSAYKASNGYYMVVLQTNQMNRVVYYGSNGKFIKDEISIPVY